MTTAGSPLPALFKEKNDGRDGVSRGSLKGDPDRHPGGQDTQEVRQNMELAILFFAAFVFTTRTEDQQ